MDIFAVFSALLIDVIVPMLMAALLIAGISLLLLVAFFEGKL